MNYVIRISETVFTILHDVKFIHSSSNHREKEAKTSNYVILSHVANYQSQLSAIE
jgi:hypothetical protein